MNKKCEEQKEKTESAATMSKAKRRRKRILYIKSARNKKMSGGNPSITLFFVVTFSNKINAIGF